MDTRLELGYLGVEVADPARLATFLSSVLGLQPGEPTADGGATWRLDGKAHRLIVYEGPANNARYLGFLAPTETAYCAAVQRLRGSGVETSPARPGDSHVRRVADLVSTTAPWGVRIEVGWGLQDGSVPFASDLVPGGFVTDGLGLGHVLFGVPGTDQDFGAAHAFATATLGMRETMRIQLSVRGKPTVGAFYRCNPRHHSLALVHLPDAGGPAPLHHIMFQTASADGVRAAHQRASTSGVPIVDEPGRHSADGMFSFYAVSPAGFQFEIGAGGVLIHDDPGQQD